MCWCVVHSDRTARPRMAPRATSDKVTSFSTNLGPLTSNFQPPTSIYCILPSCPLRQTSPRWLQPLPPTSSVPVQRRIFLCSLEPPRRFCFLDFGVVPNRSEEHTSELQSHFHTFLPYFLLQ